MPYALIIIGLIYFVNFVIKEWSVPAIADNAMLVNSYASTSMFGLWLICSGVVWLMLRKR